MTQSIPTQPVSEITSYHAHVYFRDSAEREVAGWIRERVAERFLVQMGRWHDRLVGPHTSPMYQIAFTIDLFPRLVPWLMLNRRGLSVLVHPNTDNPHDDHLVHALWLGPILAVDGSGLPRSLRATGAEIEIITPNTRPGVATTP